MIANVAHYYKENVGLVHQVSKKGYARLQKAGVAMDYDDVFQEMSCVFLKCCEGFDEGKGYKFSTYFYMSGFNKLNKWAQDLIVERLEHGVRSVEEMNDGANEEFNLESVLMVDATTPEDSYAASQFVQYMNQRLSPLAKLIVEWLVEPPEELMAEFAKAQANAEYGRQLGYSSRCFLQLSPNSVGNFIALVSDVQEREIKAAIRELKTFEEYEAKNFFARG